jgi:hypothetical protein
MSEHGDRNNDEQNDDSFLHGSSPYMRVDVRVQRILNKKVSQHTNV